MYAPSGQMTAAKPPVGENEIVLRTGEFPTTVVVGKGLLFRISDFTGKTEAPFVVADEITGPLFADFLEQRKGLFTLPRGEEGKSLPRVSAIYSALAKSQVDRSGIILALGGGVVGDAAGFAAATWMRGIRLLQCPTTLLAQVDSAIGGKTGVNLPEGKNLVGAFHPAEWVFSDVECLRSQEEEDFRQGLAEAVKYGIGENWNFLSWLEENAGPILRRECCVLLRLVSECSRMKLAVVSEDEREQSGSRARLNLGHTVGHALEAVSGYKRWKHGDAVAAGMMVAARLAARLGELGEEECLRIGRILSRFSLPTGPDRPWEDILPFLARDKKFTGGVPSLVIPRKNTSCTLRSDIPLPLLREAYEESL
ncbi:MAG: 3-dehydroquinate synthase [Synergistaceae bacterium]|nr:3-dehydroquinate synthase [Synergistaceae bacterium]